MKKTYIIANMKCAGCAKKITEVLNQLTGITQIETEITEKQVKVTFDEQQVMTQQIETALTNAGYPAT